MKERKIVDYKLLSSWGKVQGSYTDIDMENEVKNYLKDGWSLHGNTFSNEGTIFQAMVKYED